MYSFIQPEVTAKRYGLRKEGRVTWAHRGHTGTEVTQAQRGIDAVQS